MKSDTNPEVLKLATKSISTSTLKEKLNSFYASARSNLAMHAQKEHFDYLWDLKERAILEGKQTVEVPEEWMTELECSGPGVRSH
jgi:hypothetical protein